MPGARKDPATGLTEKQERFCVLYVTDEKLKGNAKECYRAAFRPPAMSDRVLENKASALLKKDEIQVRIRELRKQMAEEAAVATTDVIREVARVALSDVRKLFNEDGSLKDPKDWPDDIAAAVASIEVFEEYAGKGDDRQLVGHTKKVKLWDKNAAIEKLMKHLGLFEKDNKQKTDPVTALLQAIADRAKLKPRSATED